jgi:hypothetical protein
MQNLSHLVSCLVRNDNILAVHNTVRLPLAQLLRAVIVVSVQRGVEEVAHVGNDGARLAQLSQGAGAGAAERGWEGAGLDELESVSCRKGEEEEEEEEEMRGGKGTLE